MKPDPIRVELATLADAEVLMHVHANAFAQDQLDYGLGPAGHQNLAWHQAAIKNHGYFKMVAGQLVGRLTGPG